MGQRRERKDRRIAEQQATRVKNAPRKAKERDRKAVRENARAEKSNDKQA
jgi:hypothetical protein